MTPEYYIAALDLGKMLTGSMRAVTKASITAGLKTPDQITMGVEDFLEGEVDDSLKSSMDLDNVSDIKKQLTDVDPAALLQRWWPALDAAGISLEVGQRIVGVVGSLQTRLPGDLIPGLMASRAPAPSLSEDLRLLWAVRLADQPLHLLWLMQTGQLTQYDSNALLEMYPDIHAQIVDECIEQTIDKFATDQHVPRRVKLMLSILLRVPAVTPKTLEAYKSTPATAGAPSPIEGPNVAELETESI